MQIINRRLLIKAVLKGKNIFRTRPLNHTQKKKNYDCFYAHKNKNIFMILVKFFVPRLIFQLNFIDQFHPVVLLRKHCLSAFNKLNRASGALGFANLAPFL